MNMQMYSGRFAGRTAVVAGGASGVGRATATRLVAEGARVALWDVNSSELADAGAETKAQHWQTVDVGDASAVASAAAVTADVLGDLHILVVSAGITGPTQSTWEYPPNQWRQVIDVNLHGTYHCCRALVPYMLKSNYGRVINISSVAGKEGNPNASAYSASKAGVIALTKSLGKELAQTGVRVNCVTPAVFRSPLLAQLSQQHIDYMLAKIPMGRFGEIEEITALICWLASEECSFSTGATFDISGGRTTY